LRGGGRGLRGGRAGCPEQAEAYKKQAANRQTNIRPGGWRKGHGESRFLYSIWR